MVKKSRSVKSLSLVQTVLIWLISRIVRLWYRTLRIRDLNEEVNPLYALDKPALIILWHNRLFLAPYWRKKYYRKNYIPMSGLMSASKDGAWLEGMYRMFKINAIRGSSSWRAEAALKGCISTIKNGSNLAITPDGPRGPLYKFKPGALAVAQYTQCPIVLHSGCCENYWQLKSWDGFILPKPFSRVTSRVLIFNNINEVPGEDLNEKGKYLEDQLLLLNETKK